MSIDTLSLSWKPSSEPDFAYTAKLAYGNYTVKISLETEELLRNWGFSIMDLNQDPLISPKVLITNLLNTNIGQASSSFRLESLDGLTYQCFAFENQDVGLAYTKQHLHFL